MDISHGVQVPLSVDDHFGDKYYLPNHFNCRTTGLDPDIIPYKGEYTNHIQNGILFRSDIHLLFDLGLLTIDYRTKKVLITEGLNDLYYTKYHGQKISMSDNEKDCPSAEALRCHYDNEFAK